ncbi:hypothetical protein KJ742_05870 [Patescibacteria group bacterium]|nr:hypothetical protein [Patescibacteria group bacterium]MBU1683443.1 hypothetical protein [Patescibacteria group bacterium]MBU1934989.1 hypothetical protein [Patescibacteria group bacterium]
MPFNKILPTEITSKNKPDDCQAFESNRAAIMAVMENIDTDQEQCGRSTGACPIRLQCLTKVMSPNKIPPHKITADNAPEECEAFAGHKTVVAELIESGIGSVDITRAIRRQCQRAFLDCPIRTKCRTEVWGDEDAS